MLARLALAFVLIPLLELVLLIQLGQWVGVWPTVGLVVLTGVVGAALARAEGLRTLRAFQREVAEGRLPGTPLLDGVAILVGAAFLLTPGLLTDVAGFSLLLPPTRRLIRRYVRRRIEAGLEAGTIRIGVVGMGGGGMWSGSVGTDGPDAPGADGPDAPRPDGPDRLDPRNEVRVDATAE